MEPEGVQGWARESLGNDILTSAVPLWQTYTSAWDGHRKFLPLYRFVFPISNHWEQLKCFNRPSWLIKFRGCSLCWIVLNQRLIFLTRNINIYLFPRSKCVSITRLSINIFFSSLSKHDKSRVFSNITVEDVHETYNQNIVYCIIKIRQGNLEHVHVEDSFLDGIYQNLSF